MYTGVAEHLQENTGNSQAESLDMTDVFCNKAESQDMTTYLVIRLIVRIWLTWMVIRLRVWMSRWLN